MIPKVDPLIHDTLTPVKSRAISSWLTDEYEQANVSLLNQNQVNIPSLQPTSAKGFAQKS